MLSGDTPNLQEESLHWLKTAEEKNNLINEFIDIYGKDLLGDVDEKIFPDRESRIAEKHVALSVMRILADQNDLWIMPIGRSFPAPDRLPPKSGQAMNNNSQSVSRFQAVIVYDKNTGGMTVFDFGIAGCTLHHSGKECMQKYRSPLGYGSQPSYQLTMTLLKKATDDLNDPIHQLLYNGDFGGIAKKATEAATVTTANMGELGKLGLAKDITRFQSGFPGKGCELITAPPRANFLEDMNKDEAYIRINNRLLYINEATHTREMITEDEIILEAFDNLMRVKPHTEKTITRILSEKELMEIESITGYVRPKYTPELRIGVLPLLPEEKDLNLVFGSANSGCSLAITNHALQPYVNEAPAIQAPVYLCDPISKKLLVDPVTAPDGQTYERKEIESYIKKHRKGPNGKPLQIDQLIRNLVLEDALAKYHSSQSDTASSAKRSSYFFDPSASMIKRGETDPEYLCCPITTEPMTDPVMTPNGKTYEREAIIDWIEGHGTDPFTREALAVEDLRPNNALKALLEARSQKQDQRNMGEKEEKKEEKDFRTSRKR